ncbi:uncharacterized protein CTHT_0031750 [Thermochaetoides thermophila DSM 1495]|uniref:Protein BIG1 n=1 Tax=Chaetomium thermophilum (strain DSM 1495 / CBS 144.50 / IMI 039719) TaxID=759272 RepID=G0S4U9_CHATD|nr:hypothetical protein CTHT_0031750 [Thermochaetoides thermophila DSM 1495]EGS21320.1 hypothetical protein CTHT_0031750 [Thermochaetoides thermophila DSM 1495]
MLWQTTSITALLVVGARVGMRSVVAERVGHSIPLLDRRVEEEGYASIGTPKQLQVRQTTDFMSTNTPLRADGTIDLEAWDQAANTACRNALRNLKEASNPSGTCVCYNLPLLNNNTGTFEADLRLFQLSEPTGIFAGIPQDQIEVSLTYNGASVTEVKQTSKAQDTVLPAAALFARQDANNDDLKLLQSYLFIGQVDQDKMSNPMSEAQLQALIMPIVTLKAVDANGQTVSTNVSSNEAAFVTGVFSQQTFMSNFTMAQLSQQADLEGLKNGTIPFVLPGVQILLFPIGLIITSIWLAIGLAAYGFGTYERYKFREAYRRRIAIVEKGGVPRL